YQCQLPIEIWHLYDEQPSQALKAKLLSLHSLTRDLSDPTLPRPILHRRHADKQFQIKAAAIINSAFREVLYLDSDNIPTMDPSFLFSVPEYTSTGALFWPDFWKTHGENKIFEIMQVSCHDEWEQESGQMVIDKGRAWLPLQLAWYMQSQYAVYFQFLNGDKDTFKFAWQALDAPWTMVDVFLGMAGTMITDRQHFLHQDIERPWPLVKRSTFSRHNTYIKPEFYIAGTGQACMDFTHRAGEPDAVTEDLDLLLPRFQKDYFDLGGIGGETR
ncbi:mannosyltransferase putative-domain-containing protein, partial [Sporodiniella umbellata]